MFFILILLPEIQYFIGATTETYVEPKEEPAPEPPKAGMFYLNENLDKLYFLYFVFCVVLPFQPI